MKPAKLRIVRVLLVCSCLASFPASAEFDGTDKTNLQNIRGTLEILNEFVQADQYQFLVGFKSDVLSALQNSGQTDFQNRVLRSLVGRGMNESFSWSDTDNIRSYLEALTRSVYGTSSQTSNPLPGSLLDYQKKQLARLTEALSILEAITNSSASSASPSLDILAGNPWWATNSAFVLTRPKYSSAYPDDGSTSPGVMSFPQFLSKWSSFLTVPVGNSRPVTPSTLASQWHNYYGYASGRLGANATTDDPYTWFDFVADAMRSNWVAKATEQRTLDSILSASLNSASTNLVNVFVTNIVGGVTNILRADDILAANPWWATNSGFKISFHASQPEPFPLSPDGAMSFPEIFSRLAATHTRFQTPPLNDSREWLLDSWGFDRYNTRRGQLFTFEDWIAEMVRSNLVLNTSPSATNIVDELYQAGYDTDVSITNTPLPDYEFPVEDVTGLQSTLQSGESSVNSFLDSIQKPGTGGDSEIVLIPEFTIGGIHVNEYRADLDSPIVPYCRRVLTFLYYVGVGVFMFQLAKSEYVYYATLGRHWGKY